jgi:indole-3-glycerol phosphate synthase
VGFLSEVVGRVRRDLAERPLNEGHLLMRTRARPPPRDLQGALRRPGVSIVAAVERASPWAGAIEEADAGEQAERYELGGATAISVATEPHHFKGSLLDLRSVRRRSSLPIVRRDFLVHPAQLIEARAEGADAVALIAAALSASELDALLATAADLGMGALVEAFGIEDSDRALSSDAPVVAINARDLETLEMDFDRALRLAERVPHDRVVVVGGGISTRTDVLRAREAGADAVVVGEALMRAVDPARTLRRLLGRLAVVQDGSSG